MQNYIKKETALMGGKENTVPVLINYSPLCNPESMLFINFLYCLMRVWMCICPKQTRAFCFL